MPNLSEMTPEEKVTYIWTLEYLKDRRVHRRIKMAIRDLWPDLGNALDEICLYRAKLVISAASESEAK